MAAMRTTDYLINAVFVLIVFRQARERELDRARTVWLSRESAGSPAGF